ncbi:hypothetical protein [Rhizobium sp. PAMB 3182]
MKRRIGTIRNLLHILCALAVFAIGFAHKSPVLASQIPASELAAYALPDGTIPFICDSALDDEAGGKKHVHDHGCEACRISAGSMLVVPPSVGGPQVRISGTERLPAYREAFYRQLFPPNASPRAPPLSGISV